MTEEQIELITRVLPRGDATLVLLGERFPRVAYGGTRWILRYDRYMVSNGMRQPRPWALLLLTKEGAAGALDAGDVGQVALLRKNLPDDRIWRDLFNLSFWIGLTPLRINLNEILEWKRGEPLQIVMSEEAP